MKRRIFNPQPQQAAGLNNVPWQTAFALSVALTGVLFMGGCGDKAKPDPAAEAPPPTTVVSTGNADTLTVDHPEQFPVVEAGKISQTGTVDVTGTVTPDVTRNIPVQSLASGRVIEINAKLGDDVTKGQLLLKIESVDISNAFANYRSAVADEKLAATQLDRAKLLYDKGAIAQKDLEVADDAEAKAKVMVENAVDQIRVLGADLNNPSAIVEIHAPASGVITEQNVTAAAGVKTLDNSPNLFTISDMSDVWVLCDVYENDLASVHVGETAEIRLKAYPDRVFHGRIGQIGPILDPNTRTAKVRVELANPGMMRIGMFVDATFHGSQSIVEATVPADAVLHLHDRDWVYEPTGGNSFRRVEVTGGAIVPDPADASKKVQIVTAGVKPGDKVIANALEMQNTVEQ